MCGRLETRYVDLTDTIAVPAEWPVDLLHEFLVPLAEQVINDVNAGKAVILQVLNTPAKLVQRQNRNGIQYFFEKAFTEELVDSHVVDVIFDMNDNNIEAMIDICGPELCNSNALKRRISLDDCNIKVYRSEFRTAYYLVPIAERNPQLSDLSVEQDLHRVVFHQIWLIIMLVELSEPHGAVVCLRSCRKETKEIYDRKNQDQIFDRIAFNKFDDDTESRFAIRDIIHVQGETNIRRVENNKNYCFAICDSVEEAQQIINSKNNGVKEGNEMMSTCAVVVTSVIKEIGDQLQKGNQNGLAAPSGVTNSLNAVTMLEIIQPVVSNLDRYITDVVRINRSCPVINEKLSSTNQTNVEDILRLKTFSDQYSEFFRSVMDRHINSIIANMKSASPSADDVMVQNIKILNELMSTFIVVLCVLNGNIN
ncbi:conserved hypothetical protein [Cotesia vestalis bracovirus]|nr:conserved hypothetical protein [Cotesia vestalis bracovirus]